MSIATKLSIALNASIFAGFLAMPYATAQKDALEAKRDEMHCLVQNIYFESRGASQADKYAVAYTTMNRVNSDSFPDTVCGVVFQPHQFSWTARDKNYRTINNTKALVEARRIARDVYENHGFDPTDGALFYYAHNRIDPPKWTREAYDIVILNDHTYMKLKGQS